MPRGRNIEVSLPFASGVLLLGTPFSLHQDTAMLFHSELLMTQRPANMVGLVLPFSPEPQSLSAKSRLAERQEITWLSWGLDAACRPPAEEF